MDEYNRAWAALTAAFPADQASYLNETARAGADAMIHGIAALVRQHADRLDLPLSDLEAHNIAALIIVSELADHDLPK